MQQTQTGRLDTPIDCINAHGTSTPVGDLYARKCAMRALFGGDKGAPFSGIHKNRSPHSLGAAGRGAIYCTIYAGFRASSLARPIVETPTALATCLDDADARCAAEQRAVLTASVLVVPTPAWLRRWTGAALTDGALPAAAQTDKKGVGF